MLGRVQLNSLSQEQQAVLLGPSPAARILDLLLSLPGSNDRLALLPDCFTAPEADAEGSAGGGAGDADGNEGETDDLWCTPMQLLNEIDRRLNAAAAAGADSQVSSSAAAGVLPSGGGSSGSSTAAALPAAGASQGTVDAGLPGGAPEEAVVLLELRQHIQGQWLESLPQL